MVAQKLHQTSQDRKFAGSLEKKKAIVKKYQFSQENDAVL